MMQKTVFKRVFFLQQTEETSEQQWLKLFCLADKTMLNAADLNKKSYYSKGTIKIAIFNVLVESYLGVANFNFFQFTIMAFENATLPEKSH